MRMKLLVLSSLLVVSLVIFLVGFKPTETTRDITSDIMVEQPELATSEQIVKNTREKLGIDLNGPASNSKLKLKLKYTDSNKDDIIPIKGNGILEVDNNKFTFTVNESGSFLNKIVNKEGTAIYYGPIEGQIKNNKGEVETISISATFSEDGKQIYSIFVGEVGDEAILFFGEQFVDKDTYDLMAGKGW